VGVCGNIDIYVEKTEEKSSPKTTLASPKKRPAYCDSKRVEHDPIP
jgi:hypothetical protein